MSNSNEQNNICHLFTIMTSSGRVENQVAVIGAGVSGLIVGKYVNQVFTHHLNDTVVWPLSSVLIRIPIISVIPLPHVTYSTLTYLYYPVYIYRRLKAEGLNPIIYERNGAPGGVWNFQHDGDSPFSSAMYKSLEANFPKDLMEFVDFPWKRGTSMFPTRATIEEYLNDYSADLQVEYDTEVVDVYRQSRIRPRDWKVVTKRVDQPDKGEEDKNDPQTTSRDFDFVVVATGTFDKPFVPDYPGLDTWKEVFPDRIIHSKSYRRAEDFSGKVCIINLVRTLPPSCGWGGMEVGGGKRIITD